MKNKKVVGDFFIRKVALLLSASVLAMSTGCGKTCTPEIDSEVKTETDQENTETNTETNTGTNTGTDDESKSLITAKIDDNGKPIADFDDDLFFRTYARINAHYITEQGIDSAVADSHLIGKERVNLILGQFDIFYEVYDIDENSPYYVPEEKRLSVF